LHSLFVGHTKVIDQRGIVLVQSRAQTPR
jgi:hypothetical protein